MQQDLNQRTTTMADDGLPDSKRYNYTLQEKYKALRRWRMDGCNTSKTARDEKVCDLSTFYINLIILFFLKIDAGRGFYLLFFIQTVYNLARINKVYGDWNNPPKTHKVYGDWNNPPKTQK